MLLLALVALFTSEELILKSGKVLKCEKYEVKDNVVLVHTDRVFSIPSRSVDWDMMKAVVKERERVEAHRHKIAGILKALKYPEYAPKDLTRIAENALDKDADALLDLARRGAFKDAVAYYRLAAEAGSVPAMFYLGNAYLSKDDLPIARIGAITWLERATKAGYQDAAYRLGMLYINGFDVPLNDLPTDFERGTALLEEAARAGHQKAAVQLGTMMTNGLTVPRDQRAAIPWIRSAAEAGVATAQYQLGVMYHQGDLLERDTEQARKWIGLAAEGNHEPAMFYMGTKILDPKEGIEWVRKAAEEGSRGAQNFLGEAYRDGRIVPRDMDQAVAWFTKAAHRYPPALNNLGLCYLNGEGVVQDLEEARQWFLKAAQLNNPDAFKNLGLFYSDEGSGYYELSEALKWFRQGAQANQPQSVYYLAEHYRQGLGVPKDEDKALELYRKSAQLGFEPAAGVAKNWTSWGSPEFVARRKAAEDK